MRVYKPRHKATVTGHRELNLERDKRQRMYRGNDQWKKFSNLFLKTNPTCYSCGDISSVVDHLVPHKGDKSLFEKSGNHIPLCFSCHNRVTSLFDKNYRPGDSIEPKTEWLNNERARNEALQDRKFPSVRVIKYEQE